MTRLASFSDLRLIGAGGFAEVYRAVPKQGGPVVALKVLSDAHMSDPDAVGRFEREAELMKAMRGAPRVVQLIESDRDHGRPWMTLEYFELGSLQRLVDAGGIPLQAAVLLTLQAAQALGDVHDAGIVHRDVKPSNFLLDSSGAVRITDLGIGRLIEGSTTTAGFIGSLAYAAPEVLSGGGVAATPASDVYGLCVSAIALIAGTVPGDREGCLRALRAVPVEVSTVLGKGLAADPGDRYPDGHALATAIEPLVVVDPPTIALPPPVEPGQAVSGRNLSGRGAASRRLALIGVAAGSVLLLGAAAAYRLSTGDAEDASSVVAAGESDSPRSLADLEPEWFTSDGTLPTRAPECAGLLGVCPGEGRLSVETRLGEPDEVISEPGSDYSETIWDTGSLRFRIIYITERVLQITAQRTGEDRIVMNTDPSESLPPVEFGSPLAGSFDRFQSLESVFRYAHSGELPMLSVWYLPNGDSPPYYEYHYLPRSGFVDTDRIARRLESALPPGEITGVISDVDSIEECCVDDLEMAGLQIVGSGLESEGESVDQLVPDSPPAVDLERQIEATAVTSLLAMPAQARAMVVVPAGARAAEVRENPDGVIARYETDASPRELRQFFLRAPTAAESGVQEMTGSNGYQSYEVRVFGEGLGAWRVIYTIGIGGLFALEVRELPTDE